MAISEAYYGLEGVVPDITARRIIDQEMLPAFRAGDIYKGIAPTPPSASCSSRAASSRPPVRFANRN